MSPPTLEERVERYLSVEWTVCEEAAVELTQFTKELTELLSRLTKALNEAHKEGDVHELSVGLANLLVALRIVDQRVNETEADSRSHYVELLGSREAIVSMARDLSVYFTDADAPPGDGFDALLAGLGGGEPVN